MDKKKNKKNKKEKEHGDIYDPDLENEGDLSQHEKKKKK